MLWCGLLMSTGVLCMMRIADICYTYYGPDEPPALIRLKDYGTTKHAVGFVFLSRSKTDIFRCGRRALFTLHGGVTDIAKAMSTYLPLRARAVASDPDSPLFVWRSGCKVTRRPFLMVIKKKLRQIGLDDSKYSGISLRRGGGTSLFNEGLPGAQIKKLGRWASSCFLNYTLSCLRFPYSPLPILFALQRPDLCLRLPLLMMIGRIDLIYTPSLFEACGVLFHCPLQFSAPLRRLSFRRVVYLTLHFRAVVRIFMLSYLLSFLSLSMFDLLYGRLGYGFQVDVADMVLVR